MAKKEMVWRHPLLIVTIGALLGASANALWNARQESAKAANAHRLDFDQRGRAEAAAKRQHILDIAQEFEEYVKVVSHVVYDTGTYEDVWQARIRHDAAVAKLRATTVELFWMPDEWVSTALNRLDLAYRDVEGVQTLQMDCMNVWEEARPRKIDKSRWEACIEFCGGRPGCSRDDLEQARRKVRDVEENLRKAIQNYETKTTTPQ